jgi:enoyl-CoA hydratase/carnithine racemase
MSGQIATTTSDSTLRVSISNPGKRNALTVAMWEALTRTFAEAGTRDDLRCVILRGEGQDAFSAGADISEFEATRATREQVIRFHEDCVGVALSTIADCPVPVIAQITGACMGGGLEIITACDLRLCGESARFGAPVGRLGFPLALGETEALFNLVGAAVAAELLIEGKVLTAREAYDRRLATRVVPDARLEAEVEAARQNIVAGSPMAARLHKRQLRRLSTNPAPVTREERLEMYRFVESEDYRIGYRAFLEKKTPQFVGR